MKRPADRHGQNGDEKNDLEHLWPGTTSAPLHSRFTKRNLPSLRSSKPQYEGFVDGELYFSLERKNEPLSSQYAHVASFHGETRQVEQNMMRSSSRKKEIPLQSSSDSPSSFLSKKNNSSSQLFGLRDRPGSDDFRYIEQKQENQAREEWLQKRFRLRRKVSSIFHQIGRLLTCSCINVTRRKRKKGFPTVYTSMTSRVVQTHVQSTPGSSFSYRNHGYY